MNLARMLSDVARLYGDKPAIIFEDSVYTFSDLEKQVEHHTAVLERLGVKVGDRVAIQLPKRIEFVFLELAVLSVGGIVLPLNPDYKAQEIEYFLADSGSSFFLTDLERFSRARTAIEKLDKLETVLVDFAEGVGVRSLPRELEAALETIQGRTLLEETTWP